MAKKFLLIFFFSVVVLSLGSCCSASIQLIAPTSNQQDVALNAAFQWSAVPGAYRYILSVDQFTQSEDNIMSNVCQGDTCTFYFTDFEGGINYHQDYTWDVTAYDLSGGLIGSSPTGSFTTKDQPAPTCNNNGNCDQGENHQSCPIDCPAGGDNSPLTNPLNASSLWEVINIVINFLFVLGMILGPLLIVYAGLTLALSAGDPNKTGQAKKIILWTVIAMVILLIAKAIPALVRGVMGG